MRFIVTAHDGTTVILRDSRNGNVAGAWLMRVDGWFGTPSVREKPLVVNGRDGDLFPATLTQGARTVTLSGAMRCESTIAAARLAAKVNSLVGQKLTVTCESAFPRQSVEGYLIDDPGVTLDPSELIVSFDLVVSCPDPLKYGEERVSVASGGKVVVRNEGNAPTWPRIEVTGQVTYVTVSNGAHSVSWSGNETALKLDFRDMIPSSGTVSVDDAFALEPGKTELSVTCNSGATMRVFVRGAWR